MTNLFVIIVNFNNGKDIVLCLKSLIKAYPKINIIVVDNGSTDMSLQRIGLWKYRYMKVIRNKENLGFTKGMNKGIKLALKKGAENILLLNPDTEVSFGFLEPLLANKAEIVSPVIKFKRKGECVYDFGGRVNFLIGRTTHLEKNNVNAHLSSIDYVSGCCMLIRRKVFEKIGLLDERYFLFFEDSDFCLRAKRAGFKVALESKSVIVHKLSEGKDKSLRYLYHLLLSNFIFINNWIPVYRRPLAYLYLLVLASKMLLNRI